MESVLGRYRNLIILVGVLFLQILGLAVQVKRSAEAENTRLIRVWAVSLITPLERAVVWTQNSAGNLWHSYIYLRGVRAENRDLKQQIEQMRLEQVRLSEDAAQARRLQALLAFKEQYILKTVAAQVIGSSGSDLSRIAYIDKGEDDGVKREMAVITTNGIVGKVVEVFPSTSKILLINDQSSGVGVMLEKTRLQGVLRGTASGEVTVDHIMSDEQVLAGETLLTSGGDQIFPKGLPVGTVMKVGTAKDLFLNIQVKPGANLSKLEEVLVVVQKEQRQAEAETAGHVRAADILAQRLPSVPDKPAIDPKVAAARVNAAAKAPGQSTGQPPAAGPVKVVAPKPTQLNGSATAPPQDPATRPKPANSQPAPPPNRSSAQSPSAAPPTEPQPPADQDIPH
jgi:rod shape-determining protein MreC